MSQAAVRKITYTCSKCELRFLASEKLDIFPTQQITEDGVICLLCLQTETDMAKAKKTAKKGPARKVPRSKKPAKTRTANKKRDKISTDFVPPTKDGEW